MPLTADLARLDELPFVAIDLETTGLSPKSGARVVEIALVRVEPGGVPELVLDTLVDPQGPVQCTPIHGITDEDVVDAPVFPALLDEFIRGADGALAGAFNASFDLGFVTAESARARVRTHFRVPPHVCLMWLRPLLGMSERCSLAVACSQHGLPGVSHRAADDALACAMMWPDYVAQAARRGIHTLHDLRKAGTHKYLATLNWPRYGSGDLEGLGVSTATKLKPRSGGPPLAAVGAIDGAPLPARLTSAERTRQYWQAWTCALSDSTLSPAETESLRQLQEELWLRPGQIRAVHARILADKLAECAKDDDVSSDEEVALAELHASLGSLGWAPGDIQLRS